ncbi:hypothetical protein [Streptomyces europaeiscabiei]
MLTTGEMPEYLFERAGEVPEIPQMAPPAQPKPRRVRVRGRVR